MLNLKDRIYSVSFIVAGFLLLWSLLLFMYSVQQKQRAENIVISSTQKPISKKSDWKTYSNPSEGFSVQYPDDWVVTAIPNEASSTLIGLATFRSPAYRRVSGTSSEMVIGRFTNTNNISLDKFWQINNDLGVNVDPKRITINGYESQRYDLLSNPDRFPSPRTMVTIAVPGKIFYISIQNTNGNFNDQIDTFNKIVSTFIFDDLSSDLRTYTNSKHQYSFKYPKDWKVTSSTDNDTVTIDPKKDDQIEGAGQPYMEIRIAAEVDSETEVLSKDIIMINELRVIHQQEKPFGILDSYYFPYHDQYLVVQWETGFAEYIPVYKKILESFKLI